MVNRVARSALATQVREGVGNAVMGSVFGMSADTWTKIRKLMEADPGCDVVTARIDPNHRTFSLPEPVAPTVHRGDPWQHLALCRDAPDPDVFFPVENSAKKTIGHVLDMYCKPCPVSDRCRMHRRNDEGVWGGRYHPDKLRRG